MDVKTLCLGALYHSDASGYEIRKLFEEDGPYAQIQDASYGSIYPALKALLEQGMIVSIEQADEARADKKVYRITDRGRDALFAELMREPAPDRLRSDLFFVLSFGEALPAAHVARLLRERSAHYRRLISQLSECPQAPRATPGGRFVHGFGLAVYKAAAEYLDAHAEELIAAAETSRAAAE